MKNKKGSLALLTILLLLIINTVVVIGVILHDEAIEEFNKYCTSKGHEKFNKLKDGDRVSCIGFDNKDYFESSPPRSKFVFSGFMKLCFVFNIAVMIGLAARRYC